MSKMPPDTVNSTSDKGKAKFLRSVTGSVGLRVVLLGINLVTSIVLARLLGPEKFGVYIFSLTVMTIVAIPGQAGMPLLAVRETAFYQVERNWAYLRGFLIRQRQFILGWSALAMLMGYGVLKFLPPSPDSEVLLWALLLSPFYTLIIATGAAVRGLQRVLIGQIIETALRPTLFLMTLMLGLWMSDLVSLTAASVMAWHAGAAALALVIGLLVQRRTISHQITAVQPDYDNRRWLKALLPLTLFGSINILNMKFDIVMLRVMVDAVEVAYYQIAMQLGVGVLFTHQAIVMVAGPRISRLWRKGDLKKLQQVLTWSARYSLLSALPVAIVLLLTGEWLIGFLFGEIYAPAYMAFVALCVGRIIVSSFGVVVQLMNLTDSVRIMVKLILSGTFLNVMLNLLLIPTFGASGAATAAVISTICWKGLAVYEAKNRLGLTSFVVGESSNG